MSHSSRGRAWRRHQNQRLRARRKHYGSALWGDPLSNKELGKLIRTPKRCHCLMCANPRRFYGHSLNGEPLAEQKWVFQDRADRRMEAVQDASSDHEKAPFEGG